jgi:hypothetical protein
MAKRVSPERRAQMKVDALKELAADHWHDKKPGNASLAEVFENHYQACFALHETAFLAGYKAGQKASRKRRGTP